MIIRNALENKNKCFQKYVVDCNNNSSRSQEFCRTLIFWAITASVTVKLLGGIVFQFFSFKTAIYSYTLFFLRLTHYPLSYYTTQVSISPSENEEFLGFFVLLVSCNHCNYSCAAHSNSKCTANDKWEQNPSPSSEASWISSSSSRMDQLDQFLLSPSSPQHCVLQWPCNRVNRRWQFILDSLRKILHWVFLYCLDKALKYEGVVIGVTWFVGSLAFQDWQVLVPWSDEL